MSPTLRRALGIPLDAAEDTLHFSTARINHGYYTGKFEFTAEEHDEFVDWYTS